MLAKHPGFTAVAVLTLAIGIGANMAIFSFVYTVLLDPLPAHDSHQLVQIRDLDKEIGQYRIGVNPPTLSKLHRQDEIFSELVVFENNSITYQGELFQERVWGNKVSPNFFDVWDVAPQLGRTFAADEGQPGKDKVIVLSHAYWKGRFGGRTDIVGETIHFNEVDLTVVGVMPPDFRFPYRQLNYWIPGEYPVLPHAYTYRDFGLVARLQPGVTLTQTQALLDTISARHAHDHPTGNKGFGITVRPLRMMFATEEIQKTLLSLMGAVGFILLIACANLANLLFTRNENKKRELAVRSALGAGKLRLLRQLLTESVLLAVFGGFCGLLVAFWGIEALTIIVPENMPQLKPMQIDFGLLGLTLVLSIATGIGFGLAPAWFACRGKISDSLKQAVSAVSLDRTRRHLSNALVASEVALALALLSGAGLMISSVIKLLQVDPGYDPTNLVRVHLTPPWQKYQDLEKKNFFLQQLHERWSSLPGVDSVGIGVSYAGQKSESWTDSDGTTWDVRKAGCGIGDENFLKIMGARLVVGRYLEQSDIGIGRRTIVINELMAQRFRLGENPVGKTIARVTRQGHVNYEVVGVVNDLRDYRLNQEIEPIYYRPYQEISLGPPQFIVVRTRMESESIFKRLCNDLKDLEPAMSAPTFEFVEYSLYNSTASHRIYMKCMTLSAAVGLGLAVLGIYGVLAYSVARRTKEFGIRMALGAQASDVLRGMLIQGLTLTATGVAVGLAGAFALTRVISSLLYEVSPTDPLTFVCVSLILVGVALLASYIPARRAAKTDPMEALRYE